ncbi:MAG: hypothetical protein ACREBN_05525, partial [Burkholderiaceae bacterium]
MLLTASVDTSAVVAVWSVLLVSSLGMVVALARAGSSVFWCALEPNRVQERASQASAPERGAIALLVCACLAIALMAGPVERYAQAAAQQLVKPADYIGAVLGAEPKASP